MPVKMIKRIVLSSCAAAAIGLVVWFNVREIPVEVIIKPITLGLAQSTVANTRAGTIKACRRSHLSMRVGGTVAKLFVKEGDAVEAGDLLLRLWNNDHQAYLAQGIAKQRAAEMAMNQRCVTASHNKREAQRITALFDKQLTSEEHVDKTNITAEVSQLACSAAKAELDVAIANKNLQQSLLEQTLLKAPFNGVVAEINGEVGEYVTPSPPGVATPPAIDLIDDKCLFVSAPIDEVDAMSLRVGMKTEITLDAFRGRVFPGRISRIAPYVLDLEKQARTVDVEVKFNELSEDVIFLIGYSADIKIIVEEKPDVLLLPVEALFEDNSVYRYQADTGRIELVSVGLGIGDWSYREVTSGLNNNDQIVTSLDVPKLVDGALATLK